MSNKSYPNVLYYNNSSNPYKGENVKLIQMQLCARGFLTNSDVDGWFGIKTENAVKEFQSKNNLTVSGIINEATWNALFNGSGSEPTDNTTNNNSSNSERTNNKIIYGSNNSQSFFNENNTELFRTNNNDITITYGNAYKYKVLKNVIFRSKTQQVNANGEPIADVYEFIARDLIESEENSNK